MRLFVIRHAETVANIEKRYLGHSDSPLTAHGRQQAENLVERLVHHRPEAVFISDLPRTMATALPLIERTGLPVHSDPRLRELDFGKIEGLTYSLALETYSTEMQEWYDDYEHKAPPGGETLLAMRARVFAFISDLVTQHFASVAILTHGGVCNLLLAHATGQRFGAAWSHHCEVIEMKLFGAKEAWSIELLCPTIELPSTLSC